MCSVAMPTDFDVMVAHSPSTPGLFGNSLSPWPRSYFPRQKVGSSTPLLPRRPLAPTSLALIGKSFSAPPPRPCLVTRSSSDDSGSSSDENDAPSPTRLKKKVVFADDRGLSLTQVRLMTESPAHRGYWRSKTLDFIPSSPPSAAASKTSPSSADTWEICFPQPASDYVSFRKRLDTCNVSLENVIVKDSEICGTVKVKNLSFHKDVFVRSTSDNWVTYQDTHATYIKNSVNSAVQVLYDTFNFKLPLPPVANVVELCVCYCYESTEHWDNNSGQNYIIKKKISEKSCSILNKKEPITPKNEPKRYTDATRAKLDSWSEFASWNHLVNDGPYW